MKILKQVVGRACATGLRLVGRLTSPAAVARAPAAATTPEFDRTGLCVTGAERLPIAWQDAEVVYPVYETSIAHSFWRAQEFSLLHQHKAELSAPIADFGCGDGSFAAVLFDALDFGIDIDPEALAIAAQFGIYRNLVHADAQCIPLPDESIGSVFSNSVLEHVNDPEAAVREISRILRPGGRFLFTVPVKQFERDLTLWFGARESAQVNSDYYHRNLLEVEGWQSLLLRHGLESVLVREYQPAEFTFYYWMYRLYGNRALGRVLPGIRGFVWRRRGKHLVRRVRASIDGNIRNGGNCMFLAIKRERAQ
jgi:SAM-dependent methyltransferase